MKLYFLLIILILSKMSLAYPIGYKPKIAVLHWHNNADMVYNEFVKGIPEMLMTNLSRSEHITIVERNQIDKALQSFEVEENIVDQNKLTKIGRWLGADLILLGVFNKLSNTFRLDARIIRVSDGVLIAAENVMGTSRDYFYLVDNLSNKLIKNLTGETIANNKVNKGNLKIVFKIFHSFFSERELYFQRCKVYIDNDLICISEILDELNNSYMLFNGNLNTGNHVVEIVHGYIDQKGEWFKALNNQPKIFFVNIQPQNCTTIEYFMKIGTMTDKYQYDKKNKLSFW